MTDERETLQKEYAARFDGLEAYRDRVWSVLCDDYFSKHIGPQDTVLDLGSGYGEFIRNISAGQKHALDLNPDAADRVGPQTTFHNVDCSKPWPVEPGSIDVVFTSNFLEHLLSKDDLETTLDHALAALKPGGRIVCLGPNVRFVPGAYWDFWDHHVPITERSLAEVLELRGFAVDEVIDRFLPYSMSDGGRPVPMAFVSWYLKIRPAWRILGKQFLVVAHKP